MKNNKHIPKYFLLVATTLIPTVSFAALSGLRDLLISFDGILGLFKQIVFALALIYFFWGMGQFILHSGDQKTREEGKSKMIWGIVALFVMFSISGILIYFGDLIGITPQTTPASSSIPCGPNNPNFNYETNSC